jgi:hypothetical protein
MKELDIIFEKGNYWVGRDRKVNAYIVFKIGATHSVSDSAYCENPNGLSIAIARCKYLAGKESKL